MLSVYKGRSISDVAGPCECTREGRQGGSRNLSGEESVARSSGLARWTHSSSSHLATVHQRNKISTTTVFTTTIGSMTSHFNSRRPVDVPLQLTREVPAAPEGRGGGALWAKVAQHVNMCLRSLRAKPTRRQSLLSPRPMRRRNEVARQRPVRALRGRWRRWRKMSECPAAGDAGEEGGGPGAPERLRGPPWRTNC